MKQQQVCVHLFLLSLLAATPSSIAKDKPPQPKEAAELSVHADTFHEAQELVSNLYVEPIAQDRLYYNAINGMLNMLDPHSSYLTQEELESLTEHTKGEFGGIGIEMTQEYGVVKVISPIDDTPAYTAGLKSGDYIIWVNDQPVMGLTLQETFNKLRGAKGTSVKLRVAREGQDPFDVTIVRDIIKVKPVKFRAEGNIGYIRISTFNEHTESMVHQAVRELKTQLGKNLQGFLIDLRNNPGGVLDQAVSVTDLFLEEGEIVSVRGRDPNRIQRFNATRGDIASGYPIAVLINAGSASASEIMAGALQDHKRAIILGNRSFGKGSVQMVAPLRNKKGAVKVTVALYFTPSGNATQGNGITPDSIINQATVEPIEDKRRREEHLERTLKNVPAIEAERIKHEQVEKLSEGKDSQKDSQGKTEKETSASKRKDSPGKVKSEGAEAAKAPESEQDYQLARSLDVLKAISIFKYHPISKPEGRYEEPAFSILNKKQETSHE